MPDDLAHGSIRFSLGRTTTDDQIDLVIDQVLQAVNDLREMSPLYEMVEEGIDPAAVKWTEH